MNKGFANAIRSRYLTVIRCTRGTSAAEFAIVLPVLLLLMMGVMQMSTLMYSYNVMVSAARDTARAMAVCTYTNETDALVHIRDHSNLPPWVDPSAWTITPVINSDVSVTISVDAVKAALLSYIPLPLGQLTTKVTMHKEPLAFGGGAC